jgi:hypothetical protein
MNPERKIKTLLLVLFLGSGSSTKAQFYDLPTEYGFSLLTEKQLAKKDSSVHCGVKPYIPFYSQKYLHVTDSHRIFRFIEDDPLLDIIFFKDFLRVNRKDEKFKIKIDPLINIESGRDLNDSSSTNIYTNSRGIIAAGSIGEKFYFETLFSENQSVFPTYVADYSKSTLIVPGQGRWKTFKSKGFDYAFSSGMVSIQLLKNINLQLGHGKQKIGNGYRSLLLSDNSFNYPYARITQQWLKGRVQYTNIYASLMNLVPATTYLNPNAERLFQKKGASFQYLSVNISKFLNVGFFQGLIWRAGDNKNKQNISWEYYNPLIYSNALTFGLEGKNNVLIGGDLLLKINNKISIYGQGMADNNFNNKNFADGCAWQAGIKWFDAGLKNLFVQFEFNRAGLASYGSIAGAQSYTHYNQSLAFTPGAGVSETLIILNYKLKRFFTDVRFQEQIGETSHGGFTTGIFNGKIGYVINPSYNLNVTLGLLSRTQNFNNFKAGNNATNYVYLGFRTSLYNLYFDF